jgi:hypothetical protein
MQSVNAPLVYSNEIEFIPAASSAISCYGLTQVTNASFNESCLGTPYTTQSETITITLRNSAGNPVVAAEPYTFYIALDVNQCNSAPFTDSYPMTIASGQSSVSYMNYTSRASDCGQGSCMEESYFTGAVTTPTITWAYCLWRTCSRAGTCRSY